MTNTILRSALASALALGMAASAAAQAPAPSAEEHDAHHPPAAAPAVPAPPAAAPPRAAGPGPGMMMGGEMGRMMPMMPGMHGRMHAAAQPFRRIEGQLAFFRAELRLTDAQAPQWDAFAAAVRREVERLRPAQPTAPGMTGAPVPAPQQIERRVAALSAQLEALRGIAAAAGPLYAALTEEQRRTADELMAEHFRAMRMGMP